MNSSTSSIGISELKVKIFGWEKKKKIWYDFNENLYLIDLVLDLVALIDKAQWKTYIMFS